MSEYISVKKAAALAGFHATTVKRWARASEAKVAAGGTPDFVVSKPGGTQNARLRIEPDSFVAFLSRRYQPQPRTRDEQDQPRQRRELAISHQREMRKGTMLVELPACLPEKINLALLNLPGVTVYTDLTANIFAQRVGRASRV